jgi:hypothetical protein
MRTFYSLVADVAAAIHSDQPAEDRSDELAVGYSGNHRVTDSDGCERRRHFSDGVPGLPLREHCVAVVRRGRPVSLAYDGRCLRGAATPKSVNLGPLQRGRANRRFNRHLRGGGQQQNAIVILQTGALSVRLAIGRRQESGVRLEQGRSSALDPHTKPALWKKGDSGIDGSCPLSCDFSISESRLANQLK